MQTADPTLPIPRELVFAAVLREVETATGVWESRILLDQMDDDAWSPVMDELVRDRANRSLEHVFTLLALVLPRKPLRIAFRGLLRTIRCCAGRRWNIWRRRCRRRSGSRSGPISSRSGPGADPRGGEFARKRWTSCCG